MRKSLPALISLAIIVVSAGTGSDAAAQGADFGVTSSPNIVGSGARALGVGGAFIAMADDATAASWNPAALIILARPESALMVSYEDRKRFGTASFFDFNYIAASYPFTLLRRNMIISFNYQRLFDFNSEFDKVLHNIVMERKYEVKFEGMYPPGVGTWEWYSTNDFSMVLDNLHLENDVTGDIGAIAPAFAIQVTPKLSVGVTLNFWTDGVVNNGYDRTYRESQVGRYVTTKGDWIDVDGDTEIDGVWNDDNDNGIPDPTDGDGIWQPDEGEQIIDWNIYPASRAFTSNTTIETKYDFFGINANLGVLINANKHLTVGAVYKFPFTATVDVTSKLVSTQRTYDPGIGDWEVIRDESKSEMRYKIAFPATYGLGVAWRFNDNFTMALDLAYIAWQDFKIQQYVKTGGKSSPTGMGTRADLYEAGLRTSAVNGVDTEYADIDGVITARLGAEYRFILPKTVIPLRLGFVYDPEPAQGNPDDFYAVTTGAGVVLFKRFLLDAAYQYRWSDSATVATVTDANARLVNEVHSAVTQHMVLLSTILYF